MTISHPKRSKYKISSSRPSKKDLDTLWREVIFTRDKNRCQYNCGRSEGLAPHHIKPKGKYTRMRWDPDNGLTLCYMHHLGNGGAHLDGVTFGDWFKDTYPDRWLWLKRRGQITDHSPIDYNAIKLFLNAKLNDLR